MKKRNFILPLLLICVGLYAQPVHTVLPERESVFPSRNAAAVETNNNLAQDYFYEDFEDEYFPPSGWTSINISGADSWAKTILASDPPLYYASIPVNEATVSSPSIDWLIMPQLLIESGDSLRFKITKEYYNEADTIHILISTENAFEHDSASLKNSFSDTLLVIDLTTCFNNWEILSVPLEKYAGKGIYIGFYKYSPCNGSTCLDDVSVGKFPAIDAAIRSVAAPQMTGVGSPYKIKARFFSYGSVKQSFDVHCEIPEAGYSKIITFNDVSVSSLIGAVYDDWVPADTGKYNIKVFTKAQGDENPENDSVSVSVRSVENAQGLKWLSETEMPAGRSYHGAAFYLKKSDIKDKIDTGYIFVVGGYENYALTGNIIKYNTISRSWSRADTSLPTSLVMHRVVQAGGKLYIIGGSVTGSGSASPKLYIYDIEEDKLTQGADMIYAAYNYASGVLGDSLIYIIGGCYPQNNSGVAQIYNINTDSWSLGSPIEGAFVYQAFGAVCGNQIVLSGELLQTKLETLLIYGIIDSLDPYKITWRIEKGYPSGEAYSMSAGSWNGIDKKYIFFSQGACEFNFIKDTWLYDVKRGKWMTCPPKITGSTQSSEMIPVVRNDSAFVAVVGGYGPLNSPISNEWLYIGPSDLDSSVIGAAEEPNSPAPVLYSLSQNYPNPFNPSTVINYSIAEAGYVELKVYNMLGQDIKTLVNEMKNAGRHEVKFNAAGMNLSSGVYLYRIKAGSFVQTKKLMLTK